MVATPNQVYVSVALEAVKHGQHVAVTKPLSDFDLQGAGICQETTYLTNRLPACPPTNASTSSRLIRGRFWGIVNFSTAMALP